MASLVCGRLASLSAVHLYWPASARCMLLSVKTPLALLHLSADVTPPTLCRMYVIGDVPDAVHVNTVLSPSLLGEETAAFPLDMGTEKA